MEFIKHGLLLKRPKGADDPDYAVNYSSMSALNDHKQRIGDLRWFIGHSSPEVKQVIMDHCPWYATDRFLEHRRVDNLNDDRVLVRYLKAGAFEGKDWYNLRGLKLTDRCRAVIQVLVMCRVICVKRSKETCPLGLLNVDLMRVLFTYLIPT